MRLAKVASFFLPLRTIPGCDNTHKMLWIGCNSGILGHVAAPETAGRLPVENVISVYVSFRLPNEAWLHIKRSCLNLAVAWKGL